MTKENWEIPRLWKVKMVLLEHLFIKIMEIRRKGS